MTAFMWLLCLQLALGLFDILYHHETTERLSWRPSARRELRLHGLRNLCYAAIFLTFAWVEWRGLLAWGFGLLLLFELAITLVDFLEEDRSRQLPPSERVTHTLLALNYGALLALFLPTLAAWAAEPTSIGFVDQGAWSYFLGACSAGVLACGARDLMRAGRLAAEPRSARGLAAALSPRRSVLVLGGSGFLGRRLLEALVAGGHRVSLVTRDPRKAAFLPRPLTLYGSLEEVPDDAAFDAVVQLAGEPVSQLWSRAARRRIVESRVGVTEQLTEWIARAQSRPPVLVAASAVGIYGDAGEASVTEKSPAGPGFAGESRRQAEAAAAAAERLGVRVVSLRFGLILAAEGGILGRLMLPFELGLALRFGRARQWLSWIHRDDAVAMICWAAAHSEVAGAINATAPQPVRQEEFAQLLSRALRPRALPRPLSLSLPAPLLARGLGAMGRELFLASQKVLPARALELGFRFRFPLLAGALAEIAGRRQPRGMSAALTAGMVADDRRRKRCRTSSGGAAL